MSYDLTFTSFSATLKPSAFGFFDNDTAFQSEADNMVYFVYRSLGAPIMEVELDVRQIWTAMEEANLEYSRTVNSYHLRSTLIDLLGSSTGSLSGSENILPLSNTTEFARKISIQYAAEFGGQSPYPTMTSSVSLVVGQQVYNLFNLLSGTLTGSNAGKDIQIRRVHHYEPTAAYRFFDTTSVLNYLNNEFKFESYSPETIFYMLPIWEDVLRGTQLAYNQRVRRSNYSFDLRGHELVIYPIPTKTAEIFFEYTYTKDPTTLSGTFGLTRGVTSNISNAAFGNITFSSINSIGRDWIRQMTLAFCKEVLGNIRGKYESGLNLPGLDVKLNGDALLSQAKDEQANLRLQLKEILEELTYKNIMKEKQELEELAMQEWKRVPMMIYRSH